MAAAVMTLSSAALGMRTVGRLETFDIVLCIYGRALSEEFLELFDVEASITSNASHSKSIYWIVARNRHNANAVRHHAVLPLTHDAKAGLLQSLNGIKVIDSRNLRHG
jgi:hypothetical protein